MNKRPLHLSTIALILIVALTSCNRYNTPEFVSARFHHKEKSNKQADESTLALQRRDKIEPIATRAPGELQTATTDEKINLVTLMNDVKPHAVTLAGKHVSKAVAKNRETKTLPEVTLNSAYSKSLVEENKQLAKEQIRNNDGDKLLCAIIAIFIPFLGVGLYEGLDGNFWIDLILTLLFYFPGLIFALIVILSD